MHTAEITMALIHAHVKLDLPTYLPFGVTSVRQKLDLMEMEQFVLVCILLPVFYSL